MGTTLLLPEVEGGSVVVISSVSCSVCGVVACASVGLGLDVSEDCGISLPEALVAVSVVEAGPELNVVEVDEVKLSSVSTVV